VGLARSTVRLHQRNAERSAAYFGIPTAQVVEIGIEIEI